MQRIGLYLAADPHGGGAFQYSLSMLEAVSALPRDRFDPLVAFSRPEWEPLVKEFPVSSVRITASRWSGWGMYGWRKAGLPIDVWRRLAPRTDPTVRFLMAQGRDLWIYPAQDPMSYMLPVPSLGTIHDLMHRYESRFPEVSGRRMRELHYRATCRYARGILVDSEVGRRQVIESYDADPRRVHALPYVAPRHVHDERALRDFEARYELPSKFLFYPAQFWEHKNHLALVRAARKLLPSLPDLNLVFVGAKKNGYERLLREIESSGLGGRVHILGYVPQGDMPEIYRRARALVMPTFFGPTNIPPLEAMTFGRPMAVSRIYAMPEQCGDAALYFDPGSDDEIADVMTRLWEDDGLCADLAARGKSRSVLFAQESFNRRLADVLETMTS